jgi:hypothetical protein
MFKVKFLRSYALFVLLAIPALSCQSNHQGAESGEGHLPKSWYDTKSQDDGNEDDIVLPDAKSDRKVRTTINANLDALSSAGDLSSDETLTRSPSRPADWVPWHLDGMVGYYAISQSGLLGALLYSGTESIKLTWQKVESAPTRALLAKPSRLLALRVTPGMKQTDLPAALEPTVQVILASGAISNEKNFRENLLVHAQKFLNICQLLSTIDRTPAWYVDGYQLNVNFSASGQVTPLVGLSGAVNVYFDWSRTTDPEAPPAPEVADTTSRLNDFVRVMSAVLPEATRNAAQIEKAGYRLDMVQIGLGIAAGGDVGVAQAEGGDIGRIILKRDLPATRALVTPNQMSEVAPSFKAFSESTSRSGSTDFRVDTKKFEKGVRKAIQMANYFAERAKRSADSKYKLNQIEAEFDLSLGGTLKLATVNGIGQFVLDFDYIQ